MNRLILIPILALITGVVGCQMPTFKPKTKTEKAVEYADNLKQSVEKFEKARKNTAAGVTDATEKTADTLTQTKPQLQGLAQDWEVRWTKVKDEAAAMEANLAQVRKNSMAYFQQLKDISGSISNPALRGPELDKNSALEQRWNSVYLSALKDVKRLREVLVKGDDFHKILLGAALRQSLEKDIKAIEEIASQATQVLKELGTLTEEGRKLAIVG